jgi:hypothetical protein
MSGHLALATMPEQPLPEVVNDRVAMLTCGAPYPAGWYRLRQLRVPPLGGPAPPSEGPVTDLVAAVDQDAGFLVVDPACAPKLPDEIKTRFHPAASRGPLQIYVRSQPPEYKVDPSR